MPFGLPNSFLELIFKGKNQYLINKTLNNWKLIKDNFKETSNIKECYIYLYRTLKLYTKLLNCLIQNNKEKIIYSKGTFHYVYNSYSTRDIWKCNIPNKISKKLGKKIYNVKRLLLSIPLAYFKINK